MPDTYTVEFENQTLTAAGGDFDLFCLTSADDKPIEIYGLFLFCVSEVSSNVAENEKVRWRCIRGHTTASSGGAAPTPQPTNHRAAAAGFTARTMDSTIASSGTAVNLHSDGFDIAQGLGLWLPERAEWGTNQATGLLVIRALSTAADDLSLSGTVYVREL